MGRIRVCGQVYSQSGGKLSGEQFWQEHGDSDYEFKAQFHGQYNSRGSRTHGDLLVGALMPGTSALAATQTQLPDAPSAQAAAKIPPDQLDSLVAPIALYPDPMLSQTLVASTYPLEVIQLKQWMDQHKDLGDKALADAVKKQDWDPSIQGLAALPDVVKLLADNIKWTTDLGNAFLAQQNDVMDAVQRMRKKAKDAGLAQHR